MDIAHLALLRELADRGSITDVALATGKTPSAVSQQLKALQRQVGVPLVVRVGRGVQLTDAGVALAKSSIDIALAIARAEETWQSFRGGASGVVRLALFHSAAELLLPGLLTSLKEHPEIDLRIEDADVAQDDFAPLTADFDIVVAHRSDDLAVPHRAWMTVIPLLREPLDIAVPLGHRFAGHTELTPSEVIDDDWIGVPVGYPLDLALTAISVQSGRPAKVVFRTQHLGLIERLVSTGHGISLLPRHSSLYRSAGRFALIPLAGVRAGRQIEALMRPDRAERGAIRVVLSALTAQSSILDHPRRSS